MTRKVNCKNCGGSGYPGGEQSNGVKCKACGGSGKAARPVHLIRPYKGAIVPRTFCGVDPCRKGVESFGPHWGKGPATCKKCLALQKEEGE